MNKKIVDKLISNISYQDFDYKKVFSL